MWLHDNQPSIARLDQLDRQVMEQFLTWNHTRPSRGRRANGQPISRVRQRGAISALKTFLEDITLWGWAERPPRHSSIAATSHASRVQPRERSAQPTPHRWRLLLRQHLRAMRQLRTDPNRQDVIDAQLADVIQLRDDAEQRGWADERIRHQHVADALTNRLRTIEISRSPPPAS